MPNEYQNLLLTSIFTFILPAMTIGITVGIAYQDLTYKFVQLSEKIKYEMDEMLTEVRNLNDDLSDIKFEMRESRKKMETQEERAAELEQNTRTLLRSK